MAREVQAVVGTRRGPRCVCRPLDPISVSVTPVLVDRDCPGQRELPRTDELAGRVVITWPRTSVAAVAPWGIAIADADSGEPLADVLGLRLGIRVRDQAVTVDLEQLVDADGKPLGTGRPVHSDDGKRLSTAVFRYLVAEMRVTET
jgi:hypothetical protein